MTVARVPSSDGVAVAVYDLAGDAGPVVLIAHATGFHGRTYLPVARALAPRVHSYAFDFRGHGDTAPAPDWEVSWEGYGDDAFAAAEAVVDRAGGAVIGFGHSMGGTGLLLAAHRRPELFTSLVLFEPIVPPVEVVEAPPNSHPVSTLVDATLRRRTRFPSIEAARQNYAAKPPMSSFDPDVLDAYVRHGFAEDEDGVHLKCDPRLEADTFLASTTQRTWELLPEISVPTLVLAGRVEDTGPSRFSEAVAGELRHGRFVELPDLDHFGPMTHPRLIADVIASQADELAA